MQTGIRRADRVSVFRLSQGGDRGLKCIPTLCLETVNWKGNRQKGQAVCLFPNGCLGSKSVSFDADCQTGRPKSIPMHIFTQIRNQNLLNCKSPPSKKHSRAYFPTNLQSNPTQLQVSAPKSRLFLKS